MGQFEVYPGVLAGVQEIRCGVVEDERGTFVKTFTAEFFSSCDLPEIFKDEFYSFSKAGVFRGFHFSEPPNEGVKLVCCVSGMVRDILVDLRKGSKTYGRHEVFMLDGSRPVVIKVPVGVAHGFYAVEDSLMFYKTVNAYIPDSDCGVRYDSCGIDLPEGMIVSERDKGFIGLKDYESPFV